MFRFFLFIWQLPQYLCGLLYSFFVKIEKKEKYNEVMVYYTNSKKFGISFGYQIFISNDDRGQELLRHEYGHSRQSRILGLFYLPFVCWLSIIRYFFYEKKMKKVKSENEINSIREWYFNGYPEKWANKLGNADIKDWKW